MCTLVIAWQVLADAPVAVAANRDERLDRPSSPPRRLDGDPAVVAPIDGEAGGTWLGYNAAGVLVGLSNRWPDAERRGERSRGRLVLDLLGTASADAAASMVEEAVRERTYAPFNLFVADADAAIVVEWDGGLRVADLTPGVHAVLNAGWDDRIADVPGREDAVAEQIDRSLAVRRGLAVQEDETAAAWLDRAAGVLADHELGACLHGDGFGTRSSSLIALPTGAEARYRYADGPPCETAFATVEAQV